MAEIGDRPALAGRHGVGWDRAEQEGREREQRRTASLAMRDDLGLAGLLGYNLTENFRWPYFSPSIGEFWHRWHISLSSWLRDYLYIPLGGNRGSRLFTYRNLMLTMVLGGLWHGAAYTFVI